MSGVSGAVLALLLTALAAPLPLPRLADVQAAERTASGAVAPAPLPRHEEMVCRDPRLLGDPRPGIVEIGELACGVLAPVRVAAVAGMRLEPPVLVGCPTARRLADWLDGVVRVAAAERLGARVAEVRVLGSYVCRRQNRAAGGPRSEHARGRAVDIGGFTLTDGRRIGVGLHWGKGAEGAFLEEIRRKACGPFATVLGPGADRHHGNHFHLDTAPRRGAPHCR